MSVLHRKIDLELSGCKLKKIPKQLKPNRKMNKSVTFLFWAIRDECVGSCKERTSVLVFAADPSELRSIPEVSRL